ncbi:MAG: zf-HC2 domain-containing protein [Vicinamibacteraceae bacterium]
MMTCERAETLIEQRLDGEASPQDDVMLDGHVVTCPSCAALLEQETALDAVLAARFAGAMPSARFAGQVRARVAAEAAPGAVAWIPDALNAAGLVLSLVVVAPLALWWGGAIGAVVSAAVFTVAAYPLLLAGWAGEAGSGAPDPTA